MFAQNINSTQNKLPSMDKSLVHSFAESAVLFNPMQKTSCIYQIKSISNNKIYIGSALDFKSRKDRHLQKLRTNAHHSYKLQNHYNKYGESDLHFSLIEPVLFPELLIEREQYWMDTLKPEFNICKIAGSSLGVKRTDDFKNRISIAKLRKKHRPECSLEKSLRMKGKRNSLGFHHTEIAKLNIKLNNGRIRKILQFDLYGNFIKEWRCIKDAALSLNINQSAIGVCCMGKIKTSGKYKWEYKK